MLTLGISAPGNFSILGYYSPYSHHIDLSSASYTLKGLKCLGTATYMPNGIHQDQTTG